LPSRWGSGRDRDGTWQKLNQDQQLWANTSKLVHFTSSVPDFNILVDPFQPKLLSHIADFHQLRPEHLMQHLMQHFIQGSQHFPSVVKSVAGVRAPISTGRCYRPHCTALVTAAVTGQSSPASRGQGRVWSRQGDRPSVLETLNCAPNCTLTCIINCAILYTKLYTKLIFVLLRWPEGQLRRRGSRCKNRHHISIFNSQGRCLLHIGRHISMKAVQCSAVQCIAAQCSAWRRSAVQRSTVQVTAGQSWLH
jgi:hypothetical protein